MTRVMSVIIILMTLTMLSGCSEKADQEVIEFVEHAKAQQTEHVESLPVFPPPKFFQYTADKLRDPFEPFVVTTAKGKQTAMRTEGSPDLNRLREPLELYSLDSLKMVGTLEREGKYFALLKDSNSILHRVIIGNYIGQNSGKIEKITEKEIEVKEWITDGKGGWREHWVTIHLTP
jgi:type IV pilus assembly protein PilP